MEIIQLLTRTGRQVTGDSVIYTDNFVLLQNKKIKDNKVFITSEPFNLDQVASITRVIDAETRDFPEPNPILLVEQPQVICDLESGC